MAKMGRPRTFSSPEALWETFEAYRDHTKNNPRIKVEYVGKDAVRVETPLECPLTIDGFECYCYDQGICEDLGHYFCNRDGRYSEFITICSRIKKAVRTDQINGGMVGQYNPSITQRLNGLVEKQQVDLTADVKLPEWMK